jgi:hypothetical protein
MSWIPIVKKNQIKFEYIENIKNNDITLDDNDEDNQIDLNIRDIDDEFEYKYLTNICNIRTDFREYIEKEYLPFLNNSTIGSNYNFQDFIKYNSKNYYKLEKEINTHNEEYMKKLEEENDELYDINYYSEYELNKKYSTS